MDDAEFLSRMQAERKAQIGMGWTHEHDDTVENKGQLVLGAVGYALATVGSSSPDDGQPDLIFISDTVDDLWPWERDPPVLDEAKVGHRDRISLLVKAATLLWAEAERLQRAAG